MPRSWPVTTFLGDFTAGPPSLPSRSSVDLQAGKTALRQVATQRGRQYELGVVQAGTMTVDLTDASEYLNPASTTSPWNTGANTLLPYRCLQFGAYWNAATLSTAGNLFNSTNRPAYNPGNANLNAYDPSFETSLGALATGAGTPAMALSTAQKFDGLQSASIAFTATTEIVQITAPFLNTGLPVTFSVYVYVPAGTTLNLAMVNSGGGYGPTIASTASTVSGAWQRLIVTGAPSTPSVTMRFSVTGTAAATVYLDAMQLEFGSSASAFTTSGPTWNAVFTGYVERYPQTWDSAGFRGLKPLVSVDALSPLSRIPIRQSYAATIAADNPQVYIPYNDTSGPQVVQRPTGGQQMIGFTQLGSNSGAVNFAGDTFLDGSKAVSLVQQNTNPVVFNDTAQITWLGTRQGGLAMNPQSFTWEGWVRATSGVFFFGVGSMGVGESTINSFVPAVHLALRIYAGSMSWEYKDAAGALQINVLTPGAKLYPDGQWHYMCIAFVGNSTFVLTRDAGSTAPGAFLVGTPPASSLDNMFVTSDTNFGDPISNVSVANVAIYATPLSAAQKTNHYQRGIGYLGELSGNRANRLLTQYWSTNIVTDTGKTAMSTDFYYSPPSTPGSPSQPKQALSVLQDIAATEGGLLWADTSGRVRFDSRETRYTNSPTARFTFGENTAAGELPYDGGLRYEYDGTYVYSEADLTGGTGTQLPPIVNTTSQTNYGQRILSATLFMASDWDVQQAGQFYVQRYSAPPGGRGSTAPMRISKITINPAENPNLWQAALSLDIGARITVKRRTSPGTTMTGDYYIEQVSHNVNAAASTWTVDYQLSPVWNPQVWILGDNAKGVLGTTSICVY